MLILLQHHHRGTFSQYKPISQPIERTRGFDWIVIVCRQSGQEIESSHAKRMNHAVGSPRKHHVCFTAPNDFRRFADGLITGCTGGQTIRIGTLSVKHTGDMTNRHIRFLLQFHDRIKRVQSGSCKFHQIEVAISIQRLSHHGSERHEILVAFATSHVDAEPTRIFDHIAHARSIKRLLRRSSSKFGVASTKFPKLRIVDNACDIPIFDLRRDFSGKLTGVKNGRVTNSRLSFFESRPNGFNIVSKRIDNAYASDNHATTFT